MREKLARLLASCTALLIVGMVLWFALLQETRIENAGEGVDPASWAELYPQHYASFMRTAENYGRTRYGGSEPYDRLQDNPFRQRAWAGYAFELEYTEARGHFHALADQRASRRTREREQPAGCINCHAAEAPGLIAEQGWIELHSKQLADVDANLHFGSSCSDCHAVDTMALAISRPALLNALAAQGVDAAELGRAELRTYVCSQCHVEYYFRDTDQTLTFPWAQGRRVEDIERYYEEVAHTDWVHPQTGAALIKMQHPESELHAAGLHAARGVSCADCHMPTVQEAGLRISDHWIRSPLLQIEAACLGCHRRETVATLTARVYGVQDATVALLGNAEKALTGLMDAIVAARADGATDAELADARGAHRRAQLRWDFIDAENSTGFHAPDEAARILRDAAAIADAGRQTLAR